MRHTPVMTGRPPDPRMPPSLIALIAHALLTILFFHPVPATAAAVVQTSSSATDGRWLPPVDAVNESDVLKTFIPPEMPWSAAHRGIDIRAPGNTVQAPEDGEVTFAGVVVDRPVISIRHGDGLISSFEPVESDLEVGDAVSRGQAVGTISDEIAHCEVQCLHWGVRKPDAWQIGSTVRDLYIDPAFLLGWSEPSILWPIHSDPPR